MPPVEAPAAGPTRSLPRLLLVLAAAFLVARIATGVYERAHPPTRVELVEWQPIESAEARSKASGLPVLYDFSADWCGPCRLMQQEVFADRPSAEAINRLYIPVRVLDRQREEGSNPPEVDSLQARYGVSAFPTLVVVPPDGSPSTQIMGYPGKSALMQQLTQEGVKVRLERRLGR